MTAAPGVGWEGVSRRFGETVALAELTLEARAGELLTLVGPSGSGKTTALRLLAGLDTPSAGTLHIAGRDVTAEPPQRRDVAMVFADLALFPHLTVAENLAFGPVLRREDKADVAARVREVAGTLGLEGLETRYPDELSSGQRQRVALGRAMVRRPAVWLLDEPLSSLDAPLRAAARAEIAAVHRRLGCTSVHVTHDQAEALTLGDRVAVLLEGRLAQVGTPEALYDAPDTLAVARFLGSPTLSTAPGGGILGGLEGTTVGVRPEDLALDPEGPIPARVEAVERLGSETILRVAVEPEPRAGVGPEEQLGLEPERRVGAAPEAPVGVELEARVGVEMEARLAVRCGPRVAAAVGDTLRLRVTRRLVFDADGRRVEGR